MEQRKLKSRRTASYTPLRKVCQNTFPDNTSLQQQLKELIQRGFAKEVSQLLKLYKSGQEPLLAQALLQLAAMGEGRLLYACFHIKGTHQGEELLDLFAAQKETNHLLNQLIIASAAGQHRLVAQLLPVLRGEKEDPHFLHLLNEKEGEFAECLLAEKGKYPEEIHTLSSLALQKELFFLSQVASKEVFNFCLSICKSSKEEKKSLDRLGLIHFLVAHKPGLIETWIKGISEEEIFEKAEAEITLAISQLDQKIVQKMNDYKGDFKELVEAKAFAALAADLLLTAAGNLNYPLITRIKQSVFYQTQLKEGNDTARYLENVFQWFLSYPPFSIKISAIKAPKNSSSPSLQLIREICDLPTNQPLTDRHAQIAVLSALMSRPRQSSGIGSCFGTNILIQTHSSPENLLFVIEDYASLITSGKITRTLAKNGMPYTLDFPVRLFAEESKKGIEGEHLLVKTLEFIIASMANKAEVLVYKNMSHFDSWGIIGIRLWGINYRGTQNHLEVIERDEILQAIREAFQEMVDARYDPFIQYKGAQAGFNLTDRETAKTIQTDTQYRDLLIKVIKRAEQKLGERLRGQQEVIQRTFSELLDWMGGDVDEPDSFLGSLKFKQGKEGIDSLYADKGGAHVPRCRYTYYEEYQEHDSTHAVSLSYSSQDVHTIVHLLDQMPNQQKDIYLKNPAQLGPLGVPKHALSFMPGPLLQQLNEGKTVDELMTGWQGIAKQKGQMIPSKEQKSAIVADFILSFPEKSRPLLEGAIKQSTLLEEVVNLETFAHQFLEIANQVDGSFELKKKWAGKLEDSIFKVMPDSRFTTVPIGDLNWNSGHRNIYLYFGCSLVTQQLQTYVATPNLSRMRTYKDHLEIYTEQIIPQKAKLW